MMLDYELLKLIWWCLIGVLLIGFAIADGMDMGTGILLPVVGRSDAERRSAINTIAPHWDGNQVWLITAGGAIFAAWPVVYAIAFSSFYFAMLLVLLALFFRPVGFDYRSKIESTRWRSSWDWLIWFGSLVPALVFGVAFGNLLQGVPLEVDGLMRASYAGSFFGLLNPFALLCGLVSVLMLSIHGGVWLMARADERVATRARRIVLGAGPLLLVLYLLAGVWMITSGMGYRLAAIGDVSGAMRLLDKQVVGAAWLDGVGIHAWLAPMLGIAMILATWLLAWGSRPGLALVTSSLSVAAVIASAGVAMFPFLMPSSLQPEASLTLWDATSSQLTLSVMFWVALVMTPVILAYTSWCYVKMWRRVRVAEIERDAHALY